ncbi:MAG: zinc-ribbon domain-containing protein [Ruminococcaceae bacterium]|nr:zinc-ribbon domain-containing protein [Oscillospiraceae bacterium]
MRFCQKCGKEIMDEAVVCPGCGCSVKNETAPVEFEVPKSAKNAKIFGILAILLLAPFGIPAIILANKSKAETGGVMCKQAKAGLICGIVGLCWWGFSLIMFMSGI